MPSRKATWPARLSPKFAAVLRLAFSDVADAGGSRDRPFRPEDADQVVEFVAQWRHAARIIIHCVGGASRSPGVALGPCDLYGWPADTIERSKPFWNTLVRRVLAAGAPGRRTGHVGR